MRAVFRQAIIAFAIMAAAFVGLKFTTGGLAFALIATGWLSFSYLGMLLISLLNSEGNNEDDDGSWLSDDDWLNKRHDEGINPATGLPMCGGVDSAGNPYGVDNSRLSASSSSDWDSGSLFKDDFGSSSSSSFGSDSSSSFGSGMDSGPSFGSSF